MKSILTLVLLAGLGVGAYLVWGRAPVIDDLVMTDGEGGQVDLDSMLGDREHLLLVILLPRCPVSRFAQQLLAGLYDSHAERLAMVGLFAGNNTQAQRFSDEQQVPFPVYGIRSAADPFKVNELIETIGQSGCGRATVKGGTIVVLDRSHRVVLRLEGEQVRELPDRLKEL